MFDAIIVSCEHGGNQVPEAYTAQFAGKEELLMSHRGWDPGALESARYIAEVLQCPLFFGEISRLVVELNRSLNAPDLFSESMQGLTEKQKQDVLENIYKPYWDSITTTVRELASSNNKLLHLSIHSFTPVLNGEVRDADIGLLFDPERELEVLGAEQYRRGLAETLPGLRIKDNYPYLGTSDGLTTELRKQFPADNYAGIEIEINQKIPMDSGPLWASVKEGLAAAAKGLLNK